VASLQKITLTGSVTSSAVVNAAKGNNSPSRSAKTLPEAALLLG